MHKDSTRQFSKTGYMNGWQTFEKMYNAIQRMQAEA